MRNRFRVFPRSGGQCRLPGLLGDAQVMLARVQHGFRVDEEVDRHRPSSVIDLVRHEPEGTSDTHPDVNVELGAPANPPGFDEQLLGLEPGSTKTFTLHYPSDYGVTELAVFDRRTRRLLRSCRE